MDKIKTYRCQNDDCQYFLVNKKKGNKKRKTLFKGVVVGDSYVIAECPVCRVTLEVNVEVKENVDNNAMSVIELLKRERPGANS